MKPEVLKGGNMKPKVYITRKIPEPAFALINKSCEITLHKKEKPPTREEIIKNIAGKDALLCLLTDRIDSEVLEAGSDLKVISTLSTGFEHIDVAAATKKGIYIGYTPGVLTEATADLAFALILAASRNIVQADKFVRGKRWKISWSPSLFLGQSVRGSTIGIIGLGRIGKAMAQRAGGFNMRVLYSDVRRTSPGEEKRLRLEYRSLNDLLRESDFITIHTPLTKETFHMINAKRLGLMKPTAILVNTSRGQTVDETALIRALRENRIAGAALDVFEKEPIEKDNPLLRLNNVTLLPHIGSATRETREKMSELAAKNLLNVLMGKAPLHWLNPDVTKIRSLKTVRMIRTQIFH